MTHPTEPELALYAGQDLPFWKQFRLRLHVNRCGQCSREVEVFRAAKRRLRAEQELQELSGFLNWDRMAAEMTANIRVGLAAGECVGPAPARPDRFGWRTVAFAAAMSGMLVAGWNLNIPVKPLHPASYGNAQVEIRSTAAGIELNENGNVLTLMHSRGGTQKPFIVSTPGSLRARFVDEETGQVTINNVYAE